MFSASGNPHALFAGGRILALKGLHGYQFTVARSVNDNCWIAGSAERSGHDGQGAEIVRAVVVHDGRTRDLGTLGGSHSASYAVNNLGEVVGKADLPAGFLGDRPTHAFLWNHGAMRDLGTLGGTNSFALAVNNAGAAAGFSQLPGDSGRHACIWTVDKQGRSLATDLGALPGDNASEAHGLNDHGVIVGTSDTAPDASNNRAVMWRGIHAIDLNNVIDTRKGWNLQDAMSVNSSGVIVGKGLLKGKPHAFLLVPKTKVL
jgi:probable HAF family extracellular repeat protein